MGVVGALRDLGDEAWGPCFTGRVAIWADEGKGGFGSGSR